MRVHSLQMTAFGPFADTQVVDFEPLNTAGVFLLTGDTGAGKTSILDAICFGLFGQVPGFRDRAKTYRSQHAQPGLAPSVVLEVTLQGRRLRLTRHPPWSRPSRRARSGAVDEKARAFAEELVGGVWVTLSTRADEVGHLVGRLLGLNRDQFCQVVMLPQGDFQAFLRAGGRDRQHILETLFGTQRFQAVERWLVEHRRLQARRCRVHEEQVARVVARLHEACSPVTPDLRLDLDDLSPEHPDLLRLVRETVNSAAAGLHTARDRAEQIAIDAKRATHAFDEAGTLAERRERHREAQRQHAALMAMHDVISARETLLRRARAATPVHPLLVLADDARLAYETAEADVLEALGRCRDIPGVRAEKLSRPDGVNKDAASKIVTRLLRRVSQLEALTETAHECDELSQRIALEQQSRMQIAVTAEHLRKVLAEAPGRVAELRADLERVTDAVRRGAGADDRRRKGLEALAAAREVVALEAACTNLDGDILGARESAARAAEIWLDARERHLAGMAAELAGILVEGEPCPVCGSGSHPSPALPTLEHVSAEREAELLDRVEQRREALAQVERRLAETVAARSRAIAGSAGLDVAAATTQVDRADLDLRLAREATREQIALNAALVALEGQAGSHRTALEDALTEVARADERLAEWRNRLERQQARLTAELGTGERLDDALLVARDHLAHAQDLEAALRVRDETARGLHRSETRLRAALESSEFADVEELVAASKSAAEIATEEALTRSHQVELSTWSRVLADPVIVAAAAAPAPDLDQLERAAADAQRAATSAAGVSAAAERRQSRLETLLVELEALLGELEPLRAARDLADEVAGLCSGSSTDNVTRTALSHYVLAARLSQVVAAANQRLDAIGGGRYQLGHTMVRGAGDTRGGLGLVVRDTHTDQDRDPATLSGGETFYVSLSLALGLADVVTAEAGGAELSTLFVDEGFGSLDDDTRDEVLDELDALRSGGRSVGLVSHLSELRARCPAQLHVVATARGSRCLPPQGGPC